MEYWKNVPLEDMAPLRLNQKIAVTIDGLIDLLELIDHKKSTSTNKYLQFEWSVSVRDFAILLRDSLLASVKEEQHKKDCRVVTERYLEEVCSIVKKAAGDVFDAYAGDEDPSYNARKWQHQESPVEAIQDQLREIQKQSKKIYRSSSKIDDIRFHIQEYVKDFQLQFSRQTNAVKKLADIVKEVKFLVKDISSDSSEALVTNTVDEIGENGQRLELVKGTESMDILPYASNESLSIPVSTTAGFLNYKTINVKSEFARWFSSFIYPKIVELESKRDHAVEKCMLAFTQIRTKVAAISIAELDDPSNIQRDFEIIFTQLDKEVLETLRHEEEELNALVLSHINDRLLASNVYSDEMLFLPETGRNQIANISKDAQKRLVTNVEKYQGRFKNYVNKLLSRYFEVDKTQYSKFIQNLVSIPDEDDQLALFLKKGYLGKSFTVARPEVITPIVEDYQLWLDGFAGAVLLSGMTGSGKSTILGMISHLGLSKEIIQLHYGESYFIQHKSYDPTYDFKALIEQIAQKTRGREVVVCIDDLEMWHDDTHELFDNITNLFEAITKYRNKIFFVVTCSPFLKKRILLFKNLSSTFSKQMEMERMNSNQIRNSLNLRARVNGQLPMDEIDMETRYGYITRESRGNIGAAMMEYCRFHNPNYKPNMKSQEFSELIRSYHTLLSYISSYHSTSLKVLAEFLSEIDYRDSKKSIHHLVGQKILIRPKKGVVAINPLVVHKLERSLFKYAKR